jgi:hypothetical protein
LREALNAVETQERERIMLLIEDPPLSYTQIAARPEVPVSSIGPTRARCLAKLRSAPQFDRPFTSDKEVDQGGVFGMISRGSDPDDRQLFRELRNAVADEAAVPAGSREIAEGIYGWLGVDEDLQLALCFDSVLDPVGCMRAGAPSPRCLSFESGDFGIEVEVDTDRLAGQLLPPQAAELRMMAVKGFLSAASADASGCFVLPRPDRGPVRLECTLADRVLSTEWVSLSA